MKKVREFISHSSEETQDFAKKISSTLQSPLIIGLVGEIGTGKTCFVKGLAQGLGIDANLVTSPTFTIVNNFTGKFDFYHLDIYRLSGYDELEYIGFTDFLYNNSIIVIEWYEKIRSEVYAEMIINFSYVDENTRRIILDQKPKTKNEKRNLWI